MVHESCSSDQSFQSMMSITEVDDTDQNTEEVGQNENVFENILDESESSAEESEPETTVNYPSEAYGDLMSLVTKHKLSNVTGNAIINFFNKHANLKKSPLPKSIEQGRKYMDSMNLPSLTYNKTCVIKYNNIEYYLYHRSLINCIKNILSISDIPQNFVLNFEKVKVIILYFMQFTQFNGTVTIACYLLTIINLKHNGERVYAEQNTGIWWENAEKSLPLGAKLLSLILYSDSTNVDSLGKSQLHPIYLSIGNIKNWRRNKQDAKQLLGYLPILKSGDNTEKKSETFKNAAREAFHKSLEVLLDPLLKSNNKGIDLTLNHEKIWFYPRISVIIADWPEAATYCLTYKSPMSNYPCHFCLVTRDNLADLDLRIDDVIPRTHVNMQQHFNQGSGKSVCIENLDNFFWKLP
jgi:hypothetical protein